jgi:hypothetical protein
VGVGVAEVEEGGGPGSGRGGHGAPAWQEGEEPRGGFSRWGGEIVGLRWGKSAVQAGVLKGRMR